MLLWCKFLRKSEQKICIRRSQHCQVTKRVYHLLHRMPHLLGLQTSISSCTVYHWGWVHYHVAGVTWHHSHYETGTENEAAGLQGHLYWVLYLLQSILRQLGHSRTCKVIIIFKHMCKRDSSIFPIDTKDQIADALTKALAQNDFQHHCHYMCGVSLL
jgi:hypothetical protein